MRRTPLLHRCAGVHRGAQQRMPELHATAAHRDQPAILRLAEPPDVDSERGARVGDEPEVGAAHRCDEQGRTAARHPGRSSRLPNASATARGTRSGSPVSTLSTTSRSAARSSSSASGLPAVARCSIRTCSSDAAPPAPRASARADSRSSPPTASAGSPDDHVVALGAAHAEAARRPGRPRAAARRTPARSPTARRPGAGRRPRRRRGRPRRTGRSGSARLRRS